MNLDVLVRVDASTIIGSGHVARTLALAERLQAAGMHVGFACRPFEGDRIAALRAKHFPVFELSRGQLDSRNWLGVPLAQELQSMTDILRQFETPPAWIIVDHYALDEQWERAMSKSGAQILAIDDLADRAHHCAGLVDQNYHAGAELRYAKKVPGTAQLFLGPAYALLRDDFYRCRRNLRERSGEIRRILVLYSGFDFAGYICETVRALLDTQLDANVDVVAPPTGPAAGDARALIDGDPRFTVHGKTENIADLMMHADLAIGAAGVTCWERCFLGLPSIVSAIAPNQEPALEALAADDLVLSLGVWGPDQRRSMSEAIRELTADPARVREYGRRSFEICADPDRASAQLVAFLKAATTWRN